jgi:hypothetical protein
MEMSPELRAELALSCETCGKPVLRVEHSWTLESGRWELKATAVCEQGHRVPVAMPDPLLTEEAIERVVGRLTPYMTTERSD